MVMEWKISLAYMQFEQRENSIHITTGQNFEAKETAHFTKNPKNNSLAVAHAFSTKLNSIFFP